MCVRLTMLIGTAPKHGHACFLHAREHHAEDKINTECTSHQCDPKRVCQVTDLKIHCMSLIVAAAAAVFTIVAVLRFSLLLWLWLLSSLLLLMVLVLFCCR